MIGEVECMSCVADRKERPDSVDPGTLLENLAESPCEGSQNEVKSYKPFVLS